MKDGINDRIIALHLQNKKIEEAQEALNALKDRHEKEVDELTRELDAYADEHIDDYISYEYKGRNIYIDNTGHVMVDYDSIKSFF